ncbi:hypothetical protein [Nocardiopsis sp. FR4]|uniref:hypothetical protein n=1 Tax=Nocardiopsis sp. FR4 TaxID=2605985 RepID=UPI00135997C2|nr:hypothetical protein [Nocardiopsis sp. FR4]
MTDSPTPFRLALINVQNGGLRHPGGLDQVLPEVFATVEAAPSLIVVNEARDWAKDGSRLGLRAARVLSDRFGPRYQIRIGHLRRAPVPPAILWDPDQLALLRWDTPETTPDNANVWNRGVFQTSWWEDPLTILAMHWHPWDRDERMQAARIASGLLGPLHRAILAGDCNCSPSGDRRLWPVTDFTQMPEHQCHHKGWQPDGPTGPWVPHTAPLDHLIGAWDPTTRTRVGGTGWSTALEAVWEKLGRPNEPFPATVNDNVDPGGGMTIDHILLSPVLAKTVIPEETLVHRPQGPMVTDHRLVTTALR